MTFSQTLAAAWKNNNSLLCVGLDPDPAKFPAHLQGKPDATPLGAIADTFMKTAGAENAKAVWRALKAELKDQIVPWALGLLRFPGSACAPGTPIRGYSPTATYAEGEWLYHREHGLGRVTAVGQGSIDVQFEASGRRTLDAKS